MREKKVVSLEENINAICHKQMATKPALEWYKEIRSPDKLFKATKNKNFHILSDRDTPMY